VDSLLYTGEQVSNEYYRSMNGAAQTGWLAALVVTRELLQLTTNLNGYRPELSYSHQLFI
jgi:hypothetical protein